MPCPSSSSNRPARRRSRSPHRKRGALLDLCDEKSAGVPFSCRSASCGTCRVDVLEGAELLDPPADEELDVLDIFGDDPKQRRLACQVTFREGDGRLRVRPSD